MKCKNKYIKKLFKQTLLCVCVIAVTVASSTTGYALKLRIDKRYTVSGRNLSSKNDIFLDDFSQYSDGVRPQGYVIDDAFGGSLKTVNVKDSEGMKSVALCIEDTNNTESYGGMIFHKDISNQKGNTLVFEMRFMAEKTHELFAGLRFGFGNGKEYITRYEVANYTDLNGIMLNYGPSGIKHLTDGPIETGVWYTLSTAINKNTGVHQIKLESSAMKAPLYLQSAEIATLGDISKIDRLYMETNQFASKYYVDYIRVACGDNLLLGEYKRPEPIIPETIIGPVMRPVPYWNNVSIDGEIKYFTSNPILSDNDLIVSVAGAFRALGLVETDDNELAAKNDTMTLEFELNSNKVTVNGKSISMDNKLSEIGGKPYVHLGSLAKALGYSVKWDSNKNMLVILTGGALSE